MELRKLADTRAGRWLLISTVTYLVLPQAFTLVAQFWTGLGQARPWIDLGFSHLALFEPAMTGHQWAELGRTALWILLPFAVGAGRLLRAEIK